jgi:HAE1 family hydrophobic/amphiphilic exporter-1
MCIRARLRKGLNSIPGMKTTIEDVSMFGGGLRNLPVQYVISGGTYDELRKYTRQIAAEFARTPGIVDVDTSLEAGKPELAVYIDRNKASDLGLSAASVAEAVNLLISGEVDITKFKDEVKGRRYDVRVRLNPENRMSPDDIGRLYVRALDGKLVELRNVVRIVEGGGPSSISRRDRQRSLWLFANLEGKPLGTAMQDLDRISAKTLPPGFATQYAGEAEEMGRSFKYLMFAILLGILLAYMILASQFESFMHPITCLLYTSPSPRDRTRSRMPSSA